MRTISYQDILRITAGFDGATLDDVAAVDAVLFRDFVSLALSTAWEMENWPELITDEDRWFRALWSSATTYAAPTSLGADEVFYSPADTYYQAIRASTNQVPATVSGSVVTENSAYWAECLGSYSQDDWASGAVYAVGDQVGNPDNGQSYQCHTAHTSGATFDTTKFGLLTPFERSISHVQTGETAIGEMLGVADRNRRIFTSTTEYPYILGDDETLVLESPNKVWITFSLRCPRLFGDVYLATAAYIGGSDQAYFNGDFYDCLTSAAAGESPAAAPAKWGLVKIPWIFRKYLAYEAYALYLGGPDGQSEKAPIFHAVAMSALSAEANKILHRQQQTPRTIILTR